MKFDIKEWKKIYNLVQKLGKQLCDARPTLTEIGGYIAPKMELPKKEQDSLERRIKILTHKSDNYLDSCALNTSPPRYCNRCKRSLK